LLPPLPGNAGRAKNTPVLHVEAFPTDKMHDVGTPALHPPYPLSIGFNWVHWVNTEYATRGYIPEGENKIISVMFYRLRPKK